MKRETRLWLKYAKEDFENMQIMWNAYRYNSTAFFCQQVLEKIMKAVIIEFANRRPPKIHDLLRLKKEGSLILPKKWEKILKLLTRHYYLVRYPDMVKAYTSSRKKMEPVIAETKEIYQWILRKFNQ